MQTAHEKMQQKKGGSDAPQPMTAPQSEMGTKPDCGETSYSGSGKLKGRVAVVTGGDSGIGRAVVIAFAREGADVVIVYHEHTGDAQDTAQLVEHAGRRAWMVKGDVADAAFCKGLIDETVNRFGRIDCLVNNAAVQYQEDGIQDVDFDKLERLMWVDESVTTMMMTTCRTGRVTVTTLKGRVKLVVKKHRG